jgi:periplasmic divalent cation tolerance protein
MYKVVFVTAPEKDSTKIAKTLVEKKLAACINIVSVQSIYRWKEKVEDERENLLIIKTKLSRVEQLKKTIKEIHPYEVPECIILPIEDGLAPYLNWIEESTSN